jgi:hypothetical protein
MHTLVIVRLIWQFGANCNFFGGIAQAFCARKELKLANCLDFFVSFFIKEKRKGKN